jgi:Rod binding domain-containing protein
MSVPFIATTAAAGAESIDYPKPRNETEAAKQFEALLLAQMLRSVHEPTEDSTGDTMWDVAAQQFAQAIANHGGFGMARLIAEGLHRG